jgi:riboflavin biosynthesis pyrimidine reductase
MFVSRTLWNDLLQRDLVDQFHIMVSPVILGQGTPLFAAPPTVPLRLTDIQTQTGSALFLVKYAVGL